jgi:hypothetical protein
MFRQPGNLNTLGNNGEFNMYLYGNSFAVNYTSSPCLFFASATYSPAVTKVQAFGFFNVLAVRDNTFGARTTGRQKGGMFFDSAGAAGAEFGSFATGFFAQNNVFSTPGVAIDATYTAASRLPGLLVVDATSFSTPPPQPPLTPAAPGAAAGLLVVDGVQVAAGDRVFCEDACDAVNGGVFVASTTTWARAPTGPFATGQDAAGAKIAVAQGFLFGNTTWQCDNTPGAGVVGTNALNFTQLT